MTICVLKDSDDYLWIPVSKASDKKPVRAFLPSNGVDEEYIHGFKARPERGAYFKALQEVQSAYISKVSEVFILANGKHQTQKKDKWRHGRAEGSPLLSPSLGWVKVPRKAVCLLSSDDLEKVILDSGEKYATYPVDEKLVDPVLCLDSIELDGEVERLLPSILEGKPKGRKAPEKNKSTSSQFIRDATIVSWVLANSKGTCECCENVAPFRRKNGQLYLEVHHVKPLADEGSDTIENAIAICPNCHREIHFGANSEILIENVYSKVSRLIRE